MSGYDLSSKTTKRTFMTNVLLNVYYSHLLNNILLYFLLLHLIRRRFSFHYMTTEYVSKMKLT